MYFPPLISQTSYILFCVEKGCKRMSEDLDEVKQDVKSMRTDMNAMKDNLHKDMNAMKDKLGDEMKSMTKDIYEIRLLLVQMSMRGPIVPAPVPALAVVPVASDSLSITKPAL